jgi:hypothetical protein
MYSQHWRSFLPAFHRQRPFGLVKEEGTPRLQSGGASTGFGYNSVVDVVSLKTVRELGKERGDVWLGRRRVAPDHSIDDVPSEDFMTELLHA